MSTSGGPAREGAVGREVSPWIGRGVRALLGLIVLALGYCGLFALRASFVSYPLVDAPMKQLRGAYHVHSTLSDGRATPEHLARIAAASGLSFVILTDHNLPRVERPRREAGVLLVFGTELSTPAGHLVALGLREPLDQSARERGAVSKAEAQGALTIISHPIQRKRPWTDWEAARAVDGLELYSADSMFRDAQRSPLSILLPGVGAYLANPMHGFTVVSGPQPEATSKLLELATPDRPRLALCAVDAHGLPAYVHEFNALSMVLPRGTTLPEEPEAAQAELLAILGRGDAYCAFQGISGADGFFIEGLGAGRTVPKGAQLRVVLPSPSPEGARLRVAGGGKLLADGMTVEATGPGAIQLEVWVPVPGRLFGTVEKPWIVPSPIRVTSP